MEELLLLVGRTKGIGVMEGLGLLAKIFLVIVAVSTQRLEGQQR